MYPNVLEYFKEKGDSMNVERFVSSALKLKREMVYAHIKCAEAYSDLSSAKRLKVGTIVVKDDRVISIGYNGTPTGWNNTCEHNGKTKPEVLHAEANAITKLARSHESGLSSHLFTTHAPCMECSKLIYQTGIDAVVYKNDYKDRDGVEFLKQGKVLVLKIGEDI